MKDIMALCDKDEEYVYRLQELLSQRESFPFTVSGYSDREAFKQELKKRRFSLVLASEGFYRDVCELDDEGRPPMMLLKETNSIPDAASYIRKYQSGEKIRQEIMEKYAPRTEGNIGGKGDKKTRLYGVFSPLGKNTQSSFSLLLGQFLAKKSSVLYLNFEPFSGLSGLMNGSGDRDLTDLVYYMQGGKERLVYKLESMVGNVNGLDYISPAFSFVDLGQVREESWLMLIETLKEMGTYDNVILDLSEMVHGLLNVLRQCDYIYTISDREGMALSRMEQYEELLKCLDYKDVLDRSLKCELPRFKKLPASIEELPYSELAVYVRKLLEEENR